MIDIKVKNTWLDSIRGKLKHRAVRARIVLRKRLRREPLVEEIEEALNTGDAFAGINREDIACAYDSGDEVSQIIDFQALFDLTVIK